jgi:N-acetylglucosamine-6-phosphate deacetylase
VTPSGGALLIRGAGRANDATPSSILVVDGRIRALGTSADETAPGDAATVDAGGLIAAPGFIDLQVNGAAGDDLTANPESLRRVAAALPRYGVTAFQPTIVTAPRDVHEAALAAISAWSGDADPLGATPLGLHIEGPFLSPKRPGVHDPALLRDPDPSLTARWSPASGVLMVTLAPELPGAVELIAELTGRGIVVSAGHTNADYDTGRAAIDAGVRYATHLFNAMTPIGHREPGIAAALLADGRVTVGIIPDGLHLHPAIVDHVWRVAGPARVSAVTDAIAALGMPPGSYRLGGVEVAVDDRSAMAGGRLAGGVLGLDAVVRNVAAFTGATTADALGTVSGVPARLLGLGDRGHLGVGAIADVTLLAPDLAVAATIVRGRVAHAVDGLA